MKVKRRKINAMFKQSQSKHSLNMLVNRDGGIHDESLMTELNNIRKFSSSPDQANRILMEYLNNDEFTTSFKNLYIKESKSVDSHSSLPFTPDYTIDDTMAWIALTLKSFVPEINTYLKYRAEIERNILLGDFESILKSVKDIEGVCGRSVWTESIKFSYYYFSEKDDELLDYHGSLGDVDDFTKIKLSYEFGKSRASSNYEYFLKSLNRQQEDLRVNGLSYYGDFVKFSNSFDPSYEYEGIEAIISAYSYSRLVDLYVFFVRMSKYLILRKTPLLKTKKIIKKYGNAIDDYNLKHMYVDVVTPEYEDITSKYIELVDLYLKEEFKGVVYRCEKLLISCPSLSVVYEIYSRSLLALNSECRLPGPLRKVITCIMNILDEKNIKDNKALLSKIFLNLDCFDWAYHLKSIIEVFSGKAKSKYKNYDFSDLSSVYINPYNFNHTSICSKYLSEKNEFPTGIKEYLSILDGSDFSRKLLPVWRVYKTKAEKYFRQNEFEKSSLYYGKILTLDHSGVGEDEIRYKIMMSNICNGDVRSVIGEMSKYLIEGSSPSLLPIDSAVELMLRDLKKDSDNEYLVSCAIVLHFFNYFSDQKDVTQDISNVVENILNNCGVLDISLLSVDSWGLNLFILTHVLTVEVIEGFIFLGCDDVESYVLKMKICKDLLEGDRGVDKLHLLNEHKSLFNKMVLSFVIKEMKDGKISVGKESLRTMLLESMVSDFSKLPLLFEESEKHPVLKKEIEGGVTITGNEFYMHVTRMIDKIIFEYASNKLYGLDNSLNIEIRHGVLFNFLWAPLKVSNIHVSKGSSGEFQVGHVLEDFKLLNTEVATHIKQSLREFYVGVETELLDFKNNCYADSGEFASFDNRFFSFALESWILDKFVSDFNNNFSNSELVDSVFEVLDEKLDCDMKKVRDVEIPILRSKVELVFDKLIEAIGMAPRELQDRFGYAKSQFISRVDELKPWFDWSCEPAISFYIGAAQIKSEEIVTSLYPSTTVVIKKIESVILEMEGRFFTSFTSMFTLIQENAVKHSGITRGLVFEQSVYLENNNLIIKSSNNVLFGTDFGLLSKLKDINRQIEINNLDRASEDSGSGIFKIKRIITSKLKLDSDIVTSYVDRKYTIEIKIYNISELEYKE